jgi:hypothetical protein
MSFWLAGYPKTPGFDVRFVPKGDMAAYGKFMRRARS